MNDEEINKWLAKILLQLQKSNRQVLVIGFGSNLGKEHVFDLLKSCQDRCEYQFAFSRAHQQSFGVEKWQQLGAILTELTVETQANLQAVDLVVIPFLTRNSLTKLALGMADNLPLTLVNQSLLMGKTILAANHCWKSNTDFASFKGLNRNEAYQSIYEDHQTTLMRSGIQSLSLIDWKAAFEKAVAVEQPVFSTENRQQTGTKNILTLADVKENPKINFSSSVRMTDLAKEFLMEYQRKGDQTSGIRS